MGPIANPFDPINRIILLGEPLAEQFHWSIGEHPWLIENAESASEPPTYEEMHAFYEADRRWQEADEQKKMRHSALSMMNETAIRRERLGRPRFPGVEEKIVELAKPYPTVEAYDRWMISCLIESNTPEEKVNEAIVSHLEFLAKTDEDGPGPKPVKPEFRNPQLQLEYKSRSETFVSHVEKMLQSADEFEAAARVWHNTAAEDYEPFQRLKADNIDFDDFQPALDLIQSILALAYSEKERLRGDSRASIKQPPPTKTSMVTFPTTPERPLPSSPTLEDIWNAYPEFGESAKERIRGNLKPNISGTIRDASGKNANYYDAQIVRDVIRKEIEKHGI